mmetsp:Transcript_25849/g.66527  ORF Transcript_25849/g.66527 Transcript_25849/m.66527 type:complete len:207 (-) Transcript_25849:243-863(-)
MSRRMSSYSPCMPSISDACNVCCDSDSALSTSGMSTPDSLAPFAGDTSSPKIAELSTPKGPSSGRGARRSPLSLSRSCLLPTDRMEDRLAARSGSERLPRVSVGDAFMVKERSRAWLLRALQSPCGHHRAHHISPSLMGCTAMTDGDVKNEDRRERPRGPITCSIDDLLLEQRTRLPFCRFVTTSWPCSSKPWELLSVCMQLSSGM